LKKADEYRVHAEKCRELARNALNEGHRAQLVKMAEGLERLAAEREDLLEKAKLLEKPRMRRLLSLFHRGERERR